jgi:hypothetical protein
MALSAAAFFVLTLILLLANLIALRHRARFALSLERGGAIYLSGLMGKSNYCCVVRRAERAYYLGGKLSPMKTRKYQTNPKRSLRTIFRRYRQRHDPMLVFNMWSFNFTDGWSRVFAREQYGRFSV